MTVDYFPYVTFRVLGGFHILLGIAFFLFGAVCTGFQTAVLAIAYNPLQVKGAVVLGPLFWIVCISPIPFGIMCALAGGMGGAMTRYRRHYLPALKVGFLAINIILGVVISPLMIFVFAFSTYLVYTEPDYEPLKKADIWIVGVVFAVLAFLQFVLSVSSSAICCCCAPIVYTGEELEMPPERVRVPKQKKSKKPKKGEETKEDMAMADYENVAVDDGTTQVFVTSGQ